MGTPSVRLLPASRLHKKLATTTVTGDGTGRNVNTLTAARAAAACTPPSGASKGSHKSLGGAAPRHAPHPLLVQGSWLRTVTRSKWRLSVSQFYTQGMVQICIKQSKTDPFRRGVNRYVGKTGADLCPASAMLDYLNMRGMSAGPLFKFEDGRQLTHQQFVDELCKGLKLTGIYQEKYCGHSFRSGAATTAAARGVEDSIIKTLGRWESLAYLRYVQISRSQLAGISSVLASP